MKKILQRGVLAIVLSSAPLTATAFTPQNAEACVKCINTQCATSQSDAFVNCTAKYGTCHAWGFCVN